MSLELEIKALLDELGSPSVVAERLIPFIEGSDDLFTRENIVTLSRFLLRAGLYAELIAFVLKHFRNRNFALPWPYFLDAIALSRSSVDDFLADQLLEGIDAQSARGEASRSRALDLHVPELKAERADRRLRAIKEHRRRKEHLLEQLTTLRTQQLYEQEKRLLQTLQQMDPDDPQIQREVQDHRERYALETLAKHSRWSRAVNFETMAPDEAFEEAQRGVAASIAETARSEPALAADLAVAAAMLELWETALAALEQAPEDSARDWLRLEILLAARRYLDLLSELTHVENLHAGESETFFATAYLRAQALWGLGQKHQAIEILEALLAARPQYRSGGSLLSLWRGHQ